MSLAYLYYFIEHHTAEIVLQDKTRQARSAQEENHTHIMMVEASPRLVSSNKVNTMGDRIVVHAHVNYDRSLTAIDDVERLAEQMEGGIGKVVIVGDRMV